MVAIDCIAGVREADNSIKPSLLELNTIRRLSNDERQFSIATNIIFELFLNIFVGIKDAVFMFLKLSYIDDLILISPYGSNDLPHSLYSFVPYDKNCRLYYSL